MMLSNAVKPRKVAGMGTTLKDETNAKGRSESRFCDLRAVPGNVRGKSVQEVLDTLHGVIHPPDFLLLQKVRGLGKASPNTVNTLPIWVGSRKYTCFHVDTAGRHDAQRGLSRQTLMGTFGYPSKSPGVGHGDHTF